MRESERGEGSQDLQAMLTIIFGGYRSSGLLQEGCVGKLQMTHRIDKRVTDQSGARI